MNAEPAKINTNSSRLTLELRVLKATARARFCALLLPFPTSNSFPRRRVDGALWLSRRVVSLPLHARSLSLSLSLVLRPPLTVTGWLVDWLFLGGGKEDARETTTNAPLARGRGRRARGLRQLTHIFPTHLQARLASSLSPSARLFPFASLRSCRWRREATARPSLRRPRRWKEN